jgi:photosynthetic reaction center H subunit
MRGAINHLDVAQITLYAFWLFFIGLVFYLRREDRREGYPLDTEAPAGRPLPRNTLLIPAPKTFRLSDGTVVSVPDDSRADRRPINAVKTEAWPGAPLTPTGDPMAAAVGPGSYAQRADRPSRTHGGANLIVPLRVASNFGVPADTTNPIGYDVVTADRRRAGIVRDIWVDRAESVVRYYEVERAGASDGKRVLVPVAFGNVDRKRRTLSVSVLLAGQLADAPATNNPDAVTLLEEDRIQAYFGAGSLYATPARTEPLL